MKSPARPQDASVRTPARPSRSGYAEAQPTDVPGTRASDAVLLEDAIVRATPTQPRRVKRGPKPR